MKIEIERRFLAQGFPQDLRVDGELLQQGYLSEAPRTVRVRVGYEYACITIKLPAPGDTGYDGMLEFEYDIPWSDGNTLYRSPEIAGRVEKERYTISHKDHADLKWEVDIFLGKNDPLIIAEIELPSKDMEISLPPWIGREITGNTWYSNERLAFYPMSVEPRPIE